MLLMKPGCECCDRDLPADSGEAMICSFECTFCSQCATVRLKGRCPNCGGLLERRPVRPVETLRRHPATTERTFKPQGCA
jgi:uncharacterized protein